MSKVSTHCLGNQKLVLTKLPLYEYRHLWAEESGRLVNNSAQWSYGNGSTGFMGLALAGEGWEVVELAISADTYPATATAEVGVCDYLIAPSNTAANVLATISVSSSTDGFGDTNNMAKVEAVNPPVPVNAQALLGFRTLSATGNVSDVRVQVTVRRKIGNYVAEVELQ